MNCRYCNHHLEHEFVDLVNSPLANSFLLEKQLQEPETYYPLKLYVCSKCFLVQVDEHKKADEIFNSEYVYFSSYSKSWLAHAERYTDSVVERFGFNKESLVIEIASNDGYLLQYFKEKNIPVLGIEPTTNTANVAALKGIPTISEYFGIALARELAANEQKADLLIGNNVLAHVPDIRDFVSGLKIALKPGGIVTMEFPHLLKLVEECQFDTIYHEHFSYLSFTSVRKIFEELGLEMFDVEELSTHGGSLRIFAKHNDDISKPIYPSVQALLDKEEKAGIKALEYYKNFQSRVNHIKYNFLQFLIQQKQSNKKVIGYGAAAKGNTFLNYCGIVGNDLIQFVVDASPHKQDKFLPGTHIPVYNEREIMEFKPDFIIIFPWNLKAEIMEQLSYVKEWGCQFVVFIPAMQILNDSALPTRKSQLI